MAKKKIKKSAKKKSPKKQKKQPKEEKCEISEVNKELYEIQIKDLNAKLQRVKGQRVDLETENVEIKEHLTQQNEDKADIIAYLKRILKSKTDEIIELKERVTALQQARQIESAEFKEKLSNKDAELTNVQDQLTSEVNLLNGKLKVLDEFRVQKEDLMKQFQLQEEARKTQELRHQEILHNIEKSFILKKIHMKKDVEERLIKLSEDFQTIMQQKINSTTKITINENSTLKKEMQKLMNACKELIKDNEHLKSNEQMLKMKYSLLQTESSTRMKKNLASNKKLEKLQEENQKLEAENKINRTLYEAQINALHLNLTNSEQNLHELNVLNEELRQTVNKGENELEMQTRKLEETTINLKEMEYVIRNAVSATKAIILNPDKADRNNYYARMAFANSLLEILKTADIDEQTKHILNTSLQI